MFIELISSLNIEAEAIEKETKLTSNLSKMHFNFHPSTSLVSIETDLVSPGLWCNTYCTVSANTQQCETSKGQ